MDRLLICGMPATGKTTIGEHLAKHHGYKSIDLERWPHTSSIIDLLWEGKNPNLAAEIIKSEIKPKTVLTWGFPPGRHCFNLITCLTVDLGFYPIWFYGDLAKCRDAWYARDAHDNTNAFDLQMARIGAMWPSLHGYFKDLFFTVEPDGTRPPLADLCKRIIPGLT